MGDKISTSDRSGIEKLVSGLQEAIKLDNNDRIKSLSSELQQALMQVSSTIYA
ncbi:MAG: hypothetical protein RMX96_15875 [Nostoc sp. ChiSLP02]|nr:hypothetical protein [Nostoc sp. DedSLP05]MDZ8098544.1 hypothetical protein [Nostoc sp. DedSLP01]MDZ8186317.1 hypothetical protein [Nostoc sp. ChiSLP02]